MPEDKAREAAGPAGASRDESGVSSELGGLSLDSQGTADGGWNLPAAGAGGIVSTDITERFRNATSTLEPGELVKDAFFTLFESVGALEIMDPKMDSGCLTAEELEDDDYDYASPLQPEEILGIIDQLLCLEMAWHLGYPLSQTIFTSLYIFSLLSPTPSTLSEADFVKDRSHKQLLANPAHVVLRAYCISLIKTCWHVIELVKTQIYYEEEDFVTNTYHLSLLENITRDEAHQTVNAARSVIMDRKQHGWSNDMSLALDVRLVFRDSFLKAIELVELRTQPDALKVPWRQMASAMKEIEKTHALGKSVPKSFSIKIQRRLASTMPPRPIVQPSFDNSCERWLRFSQDGAGVVDVLCYADPQSLLKFVLTFQSQKPQPLVFIRTLMQDLVFAENIMLGRMSIRQVMDDDLALLVLPASAFLDPTNDEVEAAQDPRFVVATRMEEFRQRTFPAFLDLFRILCQNRSRTRRMLCRAAQEWDRNQLDAEDIDQAMQQAVSGTATEAQASNSGGRPTAADALPLSSWAYLYKLQVMEWVVQLGFELEVYQADELAGMYWYLCYVAKRRMQHVERIRSFTMQAVQEQQQRAAQGGAAMTAEQQRAFRRSMSFLRMALLDASVTWELADALSCLYAVLERTGVVPERERPFGTAELRYELRMRPFAAAGRAELPSFATYAAEVKQADSSISEMLAYADKAIGAAKKGCEALARLDEREEAFASFCQERWTARVKSTQKAAIFAGIAVAVVRKAAGGGGEAKLALEAEVPTPDKCYHEWWIVPKITAK